MLTLDVLRERGSDEEPGKSPGARRADAQPRVRRGATARTLRGRRGARRQRLETRKRMTHAAPPRKETSAKILMSCGHV